MWRFIVLTMLGGIVALAGHAVIGLGFHPGSLAPVKVLLEGCAALATGTALFAAGMIGLAEGYEKVTARMAELLSSKELPGADVAMAVRDGDGLATANGVFWRGYAVAAGGIALFMAGLLGLTAGLARTSPTLYTVGLIVGIACLGLSALVLCVRGLQRVRRAHAGVNASARLLERQPERGAAQESVTRRRCIPRYALFPRRAGSGLGRGLDKQPRSSAIRPS